MSERKRHKVIFLQEFPGEDPYVTHVVVPSETKEEAKKKVISDQLKLARRYGERKPYIAVSAVLDVGYEDDWIMDMWWETSRHTYLDCWMPDISNTEMLRCLKEKYPELHEALTG